MDRDAQPTSTSAAKAKRNRSPIERIVTWSLIVILLVVVGVEAHARFGHDRTVTQLRSDLESAEKTGADLKLAAAQEKINGLTFQSDQRVNGRGRVTYRWPSLFKSYLVTLIVGTDDDVYGLDTEADDPDAAKPMDVAPGEPVNQIRAPEHPPEQPAPSE